MTLSRDKDSNRENSLSRQSQVGLLKNKFSKPKLKYTKSEDKLNNVITFQRGDDDLDLNEMQTNKLN